MAAVMFGLILHFQYAYGWSPVRAGLAMGRVLDFRGQLAEAHWRFDEAAACYREALKIQDTDSWTRMWLARAQMLLLDLDGARENLAIATRQQSSQRLARGHSLNASQSFLGQILNEFMLDRDVVAELRQAAALPLPERVTQLQDIARRAPDNTAAAISLMVAMRMAGRLQTLASRSESQPAIPRRIAQYWNDTEPPGGIVEIMQSWRKHHPLWDYQRFDDATAQVDWNDAERILRLCGAEPGGPVGWLARATMRLRSVASYLH